MGDAKVTVPTDASIGCAPSETLLDGIKVCGFQTPSRVQQDAVPPMNRRQNVICEAGAGTGKTTALVIGAMQRIDFERQECQVIILVPSQELVLPILRVWCALANQLPLRLCTCAGGSSVRDNVERLRDGQHCVVGTAGRILDMIIKKHLNVDNVVCLAIDEAHDLMLRGNGRIEDLQRISERLSATTQVCLFMQPMFRGTVKAAAKVAHFLSLATEVAQDAMQIIVEGNDCNSQGLQQYCVMVEEERKLESLLEFLGPRASKRTIVFCNSSNLDALAVSITARGTKVSTFGGSQSTAKGSGKGSQDWASLMDLLTEESAPNAAQVLVSTDALIRAVAHAPMVINYDLPRNPEAYSHRIGRLFRLGAEQPLVISLATPADERMLKDIERYFHMKIEKLPQSEMAMR